jgi:hypothetical protein
MGLAIFIGNMIRETTLLARLAKEPQWRATVFGSIIRNRAGNLVPLWPERWTLEKLLEEYAAYRRIGIGHVWEAEMMNLTAKEILGISLEKCPRPPRPMPDELMAGFITVDPAFGKEAYHDETALTVHGLLTGGNIPLVLETRHGRWNEDQILDELLSLSYYWGITTWFIEAVAAQKLLIPLFKSMLVIRGIGADLFLMLPIVGGRESKASRIVAFRNSCGMGSYGIVEEEQELVTLLEEYAPDTVKHDDRCDSGAFGPIAWATNGELVMAQGRRQDIIGSLMGHNGGPPLDGVSETEMCPY